MRADNRLSPQAAVANVRRAVADGAVAVVDEGTGVNASWRIAAEADVPLGITFQGGIGLVDPEDAAERLPDRARTTTASPSGSRST